MRTIKRMALMTFLFRIRIPHVFHLSDVHCAIPPRTLYHNKYNLREEYNANQPDETDEVFSTIRSTNSFPSH